MKILSWNVAGLRAVIKKGFFEFLKKENPDILCLQEVKTVPEQLKEAFDGYKAIWNPAEKKGYSGVLTLTKEQPKETIKGLGVKEIDKEGRFLTHKFKNFTLINAYFPHSGREHERLGFKLKVNDAFMEYANNLRKKQKLVICGDFNVSHKEIDLANPKGNINNAGFLPEERAWADKFILKEGYIDTFRHFNTQGGDYTYWSYRKDVRKKNIGWRIDYIFITKNLLPKLKKAFILKDIYGSDHCPVGVILT